LVQLPALDPGLPPPFLVFFFFFFGLSTSPSPLFFQIAQQFFYAFEPFNLRRVPPGMFLFLRFHSPRLASLVLFFSELKSGCSHFFLTPLRGERPRGAYSSLCRTEFSLGVDSGGRKRPNLLPLMPSYDLHPFCSAEIARVRIALGI